MKYTDSIMATTGKTKVTQVKGADGIGENIKNDRLATQGWKNQETGPDDQDKGKTAFDQMPMELGVSDSPAANERLRDLISMQAGGHFGETKLMGAKPWDESIMGHFAGIRERKIKDKYMDVSTYAREGMMRRLNSHKNIL